MSVWNRCLLRECLCLPAGQHTTEGPECQAPGGVHVQCAKETRLRGRVPLDGPVHQLIPAKITAAHPGPGLSVVCSLFDPSLYVT